MGERKAVHRTNYTPAGEPATLFHIINSVTILGFVGADPQQRQARNNNGSKFTVLSVATQRSWKNTDDESEDCSLIVRPEISVAGIARTRRSC